LSYKGTVGSLMNPPLQQAYYESILKIKKRRGGGAGEPTVPCYYEPSFKIGI